jgi:peptidoglycan/LPS O-acetylase OafA/YrhL
MQGQKNRLHYIDWIRIIAFSLLIFLHSTLPFTTVPWEVKDTETSDGLTSFSWWLHQWRLPLLFFVSGLGIHFSLARRSVLSFYAERFRRLFIPLLFAMFFTIPLQVYYEYLQKGRIQEGYLKFYPSVWDMVPYPKGSLTWSHMWFIVYLIAFILFLIPVFTLFKFQFMAGLKEKISEFLGHPAVTITMVFPLMFIYRTLFIEYPESGGLIGDWFVLTFFIVFLLYGYFIGGSVSFWENSQKFRWYYGGVALVCITALFMMYWTPVQTPKVKDTAFNMYLVLNCIHIWSLILFICGMAKKHLNVSSPALDYLNKAVYPYFIIHQTVIVAFGYYVVQMPISIWWKLFLLVTISTAAIMMIYHFIIRKTALTRFLYGMK